MENGTEKGSCLTLKMVPKLYNRGASTIYEIDASDTLKNITASGNGYGHAVYVSSGKKRNTSAGIDITLDSSASGAMGGREDFSGGWAGSSSFGISNITYSSVSGGAWTLQSDGSRKSHAISDIGVTKARISCIPKRLL